MHTWPQIEVGDQRIRKLGWPVRLVPSLSDLVILFPILFVLVRMQGVSTLLGDGDTGWHIRTGEWILAHRQVPQVDIFSFSKPGQPWFAWEWGWDVCFASIHQLGGLEAVVFVNLILLGAISWLLLQLVRRTCPNAIVAALVTLLAVSGSSIHWLARPHLFSWLFILVFSLLLGRARDGQPHLLYRLPVLMVVWTNLHGAFIVGIALVALYAVDPLVDALRGKCSWKIGSRFLVCAAACLFASFLNPYGPALHQHVIAYLLDPKQVENILEFQSINFHHPLARYFELFLAIGAIAAYQNFRAGKFTEAILTLAWAHLALVSIRNIPIFLLFVAPSVAGTLAGWVMSIRTLTKAAANVANLERLPRFHAITAIVLFVLAFLMARPGEAKLLRSEYDPSKYPTQAVKWLQARHVAKVFTDDEWGDYLIYRLYPAGRVFFDGRSDFYGTEFEDRYIGLMNVRYSWEKDFEGFGIDTVLLRVEAALAGALKQSPRWQVAYDDGIALIFLRKDIPQFGPKFLAGYGPHGKQFFPTQDGAGERSPNHLFSEAAKSGNYKSLKGEPTQ
jgi:hypothetical protein